RAIGDRRAAGRWADDRLPVGRLVVAPVPGDGPDQRAVAGIEDPQLRRERRWVAALRRELGHDLRAVRRPGAVRHARVLVGQLPDAGPVDRGGVQLVAAVLVLA